MADPVLIEDREIVRTIVLNRPESRNALGGEMVAALVDSLSEASADPSIRAVVLAGAGSAFCAGADLRALSERCEGAAPEDYRDSRRLMDLYLLLARYPKPVVGAVDGPALAGGCGLVTLCDSVLCSDIARFGYPEVRVGFVAAMVLLFLQRAVGDRRARELLLTGRLVDAQEARSLGLVQGIVPGGELLPQATLLARSMARGAPSAIRWTKDLLFRTSGLPLEAALEMACQVNALVRSGGEFEEGVRSFLEKRRPSWTP